MENINLDIFLKTLTGCVVLMFLFLDTPKVIKKS
jgi:hypothetical protein